MDTPHERPSLRGDLWFLTILVLAKLVFHIVTLWGYGFHRDELYFLACARHLDAGYVDHPPLVPWIVDITTGMFGESLFAVRIMPTLAGALTVFVTGLLVRELGGRRWAMGLAALTIAIAPVFLRVAHMLGTPSLEPLLWTTCMLVVTRILKGGTQRWWIVFGALAGIGLLNKHTMLVFGFSVTAALLLVGPRRVLRSRWLWGGGAIALLLFLPNLLWQFENDWATYRFAAALRERAMAFVPHLLLLGQAIYVHPLNLLVWLPGLIWLLAHREYRALGATWVVVVTVLALIQSKTYYAAPIYPIVLAAGAVFWERRVRILIIPLMVLLLLGGAVLAPLAMPVLSIENTEAYAEAASPVVQLRKEEMLADLQDMHGWPEQVRGIQEALTDLERPNEPAFDAILVRNYGQAGAIEHFGGAEMPPVLCTHMSYWLWGPDRFSRAEKKLERVLAFGLRRDYLERMFRRVQPWGRVPGSSSARPSERDQVVFVCLDPRASLTELWPKKPDH